MNSLNGYKDWQELFDKNISKVWQEEPIPVLKNISMLLFTLDKEVKKIQDAVHSNILHLRSQIWEDKLNLGLNLSLMNDQGPISDSSPITTSQQPHFTPPKNLFKDESGSIIISDDDNIQSNNSPEIKKKYRRNDSNRKFKRKHKFNCGTAASSDINRGEQLVDRSSKENKDYNTDCTTFNINPLAHNLSKEIQNVLDTPQKSSNELDFSIIQSTPRSDMKVSEGKDKTPTLICRKSQHKGTNSTLTQMFLKHRDVKGQKKQIRLPPEICDSDEMLATMSRTKPTGIHSSIGLTQMISYLNKDSSVEIGNDNDTGLNLNEDSVSDLAVNVRYEDFAENNSLNSARVEADDVNKENDLVTGLNEFLAKAQNVPDQLEAEPKVRGKARRNLPGWSCKECEKFYLKQGLNSDEVLALNKCSKHRGFYKPREDTIPGFWDMDVASQEKDDT